MFRELFKKIFGLVKESETKTGANKISDKKREALSECLALLRASQKQREENLHEDALANLEKVIDIIEREGLFRD